METQNQNKIIGIIESLKSQRNNLADQLAEAEGKLAVLAAALQQYQNEIAKKDETIKQLQDELKESTTAKETPAPKSRPGSKAHLNEAK